MYQYFLSIIIPVYRVEAYIGRCLESIVHQNSNEYEVILVDDGSPDNSGKICDEYAYKFHHVVCYHKENGGLSDARNFGMSKCSGKYVWFIDSDDYILNDSIVCIINELRRSLCDVFVCQSKTVNDTGQEADECIYTIKRGVYSSSEYMNVLKLHPNSVLFCAQFYICKKSIIDANGFIFCKGIIHEDELWTPQILLKANSILYSGLKNYYHYMREGSIMHTGNMEKSGMADLFIFEKLLEIINLSKREDLEYMRDHLANIFLQAVWKTPNFLSVCTIDRNLPLKNAYYVKTKAKAFLYYLSPRLYLKTHNFVTRCKMKLTR